MWNFKGYLWNSTQHIFLIYWNMWILFTGENLRVLSVHKCCWNAPSISLFHKPVIVRTDVSNKTIWYGFTQVWRLICLIKPHMSCCSELYLSQEYKLLQWCNTLYWENDYIVFNGIIVPFLIPLTFIHNRFFSLSLFKFFSLMLQSDRRQTITLTNGGILTTRHPVRIYS